MLKRTLLALALGASCALGLGACAPAENAETPAAQQEAANTDAADATDAAKTDDEAQATDATDASKDASKDAGEADAKIEEDAEAKVDNLPTDPADWADEREAEKERALEAVKSVTLAQDGSAKAAPGADASLVATLTCDKGFDAMQAFPASFEVELAGDSEGVLDITDSEPLIEAAKGNPILNHGNEGKIVGIASMTTSDVVKVTVPVKVGDNAADGDTYSVNLYLIHENERIAETQLKLSVD